MIHLLIADDHDGVRSGLRELFDATPDIRVVAECRDGDEVCLAAARTRPHVALLDVGMSRTDGITAAGRLQMAMPAIRVVIYTGHPTEEAQRRAREAGVAGFLVKDAAPDELSEHIRAVAQGATVWLTLS